MLITAPQATHHRAELFDAEALALDLAELAKGHTGDGRDLRSALALRLKSVLTQARTR